MHLAGCVYLAAAALDNDIAGNLLPFYFLDVTEQASKELGELAFWLDSISRRVLYEEICFRASDRDAEEGILNDRGATGDCSFRRIMGCCGAIFLTRVRFG